MTRRQFKRRRERLLRVKIKEIRASCLECRAIRGLCNTHANEVIDLIVNATQHADELDVPGSVRPDPVPDQIERGRRPRFLRKD